jgi:hypothetical protein
MARGILTRQQILGTFCQESGCQALMTRIIAPSCVKDFGPEYWRTLTPPIGKFTG